MEAGRPDGKHKLTRAYNEERQGEWEGKDGVGDYTGRTKGGK